MGYITAVSAYYEGDRVNQADLEVPQRPSFLYDWNGSAWVLNMQRQASFLRISVDLAERVAVQNNSTLMNVLNMTKAEVDDWFNANFPSLTPAERGRLANVGWLAINAVRLTIRSGG